MNNLKNDEEVKEIINYFEKKNYEVYFKEILGINHLVVSNKKNTVYIKPYKNYDVISKFDINIFRYSINNESIEKFRIEDITLATIYDTVQEVIESIEEYLNEENYFEFIKSNFETKENADDLKLEKYNIELKKHGYNTQILRKNLFFEEIEIIIFTKNKENLLNPNSSFVLYMNDNNKVEISSIIRMNKEFNIACLYNEEELNEFSIDKIEKLFISNNEEIKEFIIKSEI
ncbi:hypothetical protein P6P37_12050 [Clostridium perfringens]|uniref:hypothetical protein n=2 Tax=Clostridium perfringens TaxID=1502 RepID=UPI0028CD47A5|nr:hypothetical protein [Clostridium perfringens]MDK0553524.1 hypothetical protein [Clostridium perfringens]MDT7932600.1 hypothetical protein [Clostridium perfringens]MDT7956677.1 hypothetical protein [Clostridium perfringens]